MVFLSLFSYSFVFRRCYEATLLCFRLSGTQSNISKRAHTNFSQWTRNVETKTPKRAHLYQYFYIYIPVCGVWCIDGWQNETALLCIYKTTTTITIMNFVYFIILFHSLLSFYLYKYILWMRQSHNGHVQWRTWNSCGFL